MAAAGEEIFTRTPHRATPPKLPPLFAPTLGPTATHHPPPLLAARAGWLRGKPTIGSRISLWTPNPPGERRLLGARSLVGCLHLREPGCSSSRLVRHRHELEQAPNQRASTRKAALAGRAGGAPQTWRLPPIASAKSDAPAHALAHAAKGLHCCGDGYCTNRLFLYRRTCGAMNNVPP